LHLENTLLNGQCFNWWKAKEPEVYHGVFRTYFVKMKRSSPEEVEVTVQTAEALDDAGFAAFQTAFRKDYLNLDVNVSQLYKQWSEADPKLFGVIATKLFGIRCLRQDPWECTLSFICSQNNNIKRITSLVKALRDNYGSLICKEGEDSIYSFPSFTAFHTKVTEQKLRSLGFGYRAPYIVKSASFIKEKGGEAWLDGLRGKEPATVREELI